MASFNRISTKQDASCCYHTSPLSPICFMKNLRNTIGLLGTSFLVAFFVPLLFSPLQKADAYRASDFLKQLENGSSPARIARRTYSNANNLSTINSQRDRANSRGTRIYSTKAYLEALNTAKISDSNWLYSRSNQLLKVCREKFPENSLLCFQRNNRLMERREILINQKTVY